MIAIIDYRAGNLRSVQRALTYLDLDCAITDNPEIILHADRVIFPGVGAAGKAMEAITSSGLDKVIHKVVESGKPFLGICLGTQIILEESEEDDAGCLGLIKGRVRRFPDMGMKVPHMGWNTLKIKKDHPVLSGVDPNAQFYFVHSYFPDPFLGEDVIATTSYGMEFTSVMARGNIIATQFHPEKSGNPGLGILKNFAGWDGRPV